jgi:uncharacterized protein YbaA (DUF1428 family)
MAVYVDGYLLPVPKKNIALYRKMATLGARVWKDHGALEYRECVADDIRPKGMLSFLKAVKAKKGETVFFSYIVFKSRAHRDRVNKRVMKDPRLAVMMTGETPMPFDFRRMYFGGFKALVEA